MMRCQESLPKKAAAVRTWRTCLADGETTSKQKRRSTPSVSGFTEQRRKSGSITVKEEGTCRPEFDADAVE